MRLHMAMVAACAAITAGVHGGPPNDECTSPMSLSGEGTFPFDLTAATTSPNGQENPNCSFQGVSGIENDLWYCWTATCTGVVQIDTCGQTAVNTKIAFYAGCGCPPVPSPGALCCNDDACGLQSIISCEVVCGEEYMIQLGKFPDGGPAGSGTFRIMCMGEPCDPLPCAVAPGQCCSGRPELTDPAYAALTGTVAVSTASPLIIGDFVLECIDLDNLPPVPQPNNFPAVRYSDPSWTAANLGSVFGITLDPAGDIYVAATQIYPGNDFLGGAGSGSFGDIYRVSGTTGAISLFATLPQNDPPNGPGLGNIVYDCDHDQFFVTNFEDGRIYRLDTAGNVLSTFDHGTQDDGTDGYVPLGDRPWGVAAHGGRVYYGLWVEHINSFAIDTFNEVWSVALAGGDFSGAGQHELSLPSTVNPNTNPQNLPWSMPVSDIRFTPEGRMLLAERSMSSDSSTTAHSSRLLEYECVDGSWQPSGSVFTIGVSHLEGNSAGGVDRDYGADGRVWVTGDALQFGPQYVYGIQGFPITGGTVANSHIIDWNGNTSTANDKRKLGDVVVSCAACATITNEMLECATDGSGDVILTFDLTNNSGTDAHWMLVPSEATVPNDGSVTLSDNVIPLVPPLMGDGSNSQSITLVISGGQGGQEICFEFSLADEHVEVCCGVEHCVTLPDCDCLVVTEAVFSDVECDPDGNVTFTYEITLINLTDQVVEHAFLISQTAGVEFDMDDFDLPSVPPNGSTTITTTVTGAVPGQAICVLITLHDESLNVCCSSKHQFFAPDCVPPFGGCTFCTLPCFQTTEQDCAAVGGIWCGEDSTCSTCQPPFGACCTAADCQETTSCECEAIGGIFMVGLLCEQAMCMPAATCPEDCNGDLVVDVNDLVSVILDWGVCPDCPGDVTGDGVVNVDDLVAVVLAWGPCS